MDKRKQVLEAAAVWCIRMLNMGGNDAEYQVLPRVMDTYLEYTKCNAFPERAQKLLSQVVLETEAVISNDVNELLPSLTELRKVLEAHELLEG